MKLWIRLADHATGEAQRRLIYGGRKAAASPFPRGWRAPDFSSTIRERPPRSKA